MYQGNLLAVMPSLITPVLVGRPACLNITKIINSPCIDHVHDVLDTGSLHTGVEANDDVPAAVSVALRPATVAAGGLQEERPE